MLVSNLTGANLTNNQNNGHIDQVGLRILDSFLENIFSRHFFEKISERGKKSLYPDGRVYGLRKKGFWGKIWKNGILW